MYYALVQLHLSYGIIGWGGVTNCYLKKLEVIQKWILKIIYDRSYTYPSGDALYIESKVFDIRQLFCHALILYFKKHKNKLTRVDHVYDTRTKEVAVTQPKMPKTIGKRSFIYLGPRKYNILPEVIKNNNSQSFKAMVKNWIINKQRSYIHALIDTKNN